MNATKPAIDLGLSGGIAYQHDGHRANAVRDPLGLAGFREFGNQ